MIKRKKKEEELNKVCHCSEGEECICDDSCECGDNCTCNDECCCEERCGCDEGCCCSDNNTEDLQKEIEDLKNKLLYKDAEMINYRKRKDEETANLLKYASQDLILDIVKTVDNFERAIFSIKNDKEKDNKNMLAGVEMIYAELKNTLTNYGVKEISEVDVPFDANIHNAIMVDENKEKCDDTVLEIMMKGYIYKDRVIRPAMVKVNKIN